jgi:hypothetical protein
MKNFSVLGLFVVLIGSCAKKDNSQEIANIKRMTIDSINRSNEVALQKIKIDSLETLIKKPQSESMVLAPSEKNNSYAYSSSNSKPTVNTYPTSSRNKKKKLNKVAKGAIIGAGVGAVTGAVVSKKRGKGAIIGGVIGAGAGAGVGVVLEKKDKQKDNVIFPL